MKYEYQYDQEMNLNVIPQYETTTEIMFFQNIDL